MSVAAAGEARIEGALPPRPSREELLARAEALIPRLRARAQQCESERRCPEETIADFIATDLLRLIQPARYGGYEYGWDLVCEVNTILAQGCASQAWVLNVLTEHVQLLALFEPEAVDDVWAKDPDARVSSAVDPVGIGRKVPGGVLFSGRHRYSSGIDCAQWTICGGHVHDGDKPVERAMFLVKTDEDRIIDDWHVVGLSGTGSNSFETKDVFIPSHRILNFELSRGNKAPGLRLFKAPVYYIPRGGIGGTAYVAIAVGIAKAFLKDYAAFTATRVSIARGGQVPMAKQPWIQSSAGQAAAEIEAAEMMNLMPVRDMMRALEQSDDLPDALRRRVVLNSSYACQAAVSAVQRLFNLAGARALFDESVLQRQWRDINGVAARQAMNWDEAACAYGRYLFGIGP